MVFLSFNTEVDTHNIIKTLIKNGKNVFVPITDPKTKELYISKLESFEDLELGFYNILTPKRTKINLFDPEVLDLVLVPGLVFDKFGYRIGYGGGYYDKFLSQANLRAQTIGLCYFIQIVDKLPVEEYDIPVDYILTEKKLMESL